MMGTPHPISKKLELHNTWLVRHVTASQPPFADLRKADGLKHYVDWAANQGFGVIDVNIPKYLAGIDVCTRNNHTSTSRLMYYNRIQIESQTKIKPHEALLPKIWPFTSGRTTSSTPTLRGASKLLLLT